MAPKQQTLLGFFGRSPASAGLPTPQKGAPKPPPSPSRRAVAHPPRLPSPPPSSPSHAIAHAPSSTAYASSDGSAASYGHKRSPDVAAAAARPKRPRIILTDDEESDVDDAPLAHDIAFLPPPPASRAPVPSRSRRVIASDSEEENDDDAPLAQAQAPNPTPRCRMSTTRQAPPLPPSSDLGSDDAPLAQDASFRAQPTPVRARAPAAPTLTPSAFTRPRMQATPSARSSSSALTTSRTSPLKDPGEQPFSFLLDVRDKEGHRPDHPEYDPRTLYIPPSAWQDFSPFEKQFWAVKQEHYDTVLFFQKGKFYELYEEDALIGHREFDLKLTDRVKMKMVGVPESSFDLFAAKFLALGYKVGRVDQCETAVARGMRAGKAPASSKADGGLVTRELRHVLTTGTIVDASALQDDLNSYCMSIKETVDWKEDPEANRPSLGICALDASTAQFELMHIVDDATRPQLETRLRSLRIKELLYEKGAISEPTLRLIRSCVPASCRITMLKPGKEFPSALQAKEKLDQLFPQGDFPEAVVELLGQEEAMSSLGAMLYYLETLNLDKELVRSRNFDLYDPIKRGECMVLDAQSLTHLNILQNDHGEASGTLHNLLNRCVTPFGKRLFKQWLVSPLAKAELINARLDAVEDLCSDTEFQEDFHHFTQRLPDIERHLSRIFAGKCQSRDFVAVLNALDKFDRAFEGLQIVASNHNHDAVRNVLADYIPIQNQMDEIKAKFTVNEQDGSFEPRLGRDAEYDEAHAALQSIERALEQERSAMAKQVHIPLSQAVFKHIGSKDIYQLELPRSVKVPANWITMSSTKHVHRHYSPKLRTLVQELKEARETRLATLKEFSYRLFDAMTKNAEELRHDVALVAQVDCLLSLAKASQAMGLPVCRPTLVDSPQASFAFKTLRHPCLAELAHGDFIPNNVALGTGGDESSGEMANEEIMILTGGNMAGKSTTARTAATAVILAQIGCFVPAETAHLTPVDRICSRMGANDQLFRQNSTFMVEMMETSRILQQCTPRSLVIMDELGRGTSTFDGQAIAYAVLHHLVGRTRCIGFFLTHYTSLARDFAAYPRVANRHMEVVVHPDQQDVVFTYTLVPGIAESSYGTQVAALAGLPRAVTDRAGVVSQQFEEATKAEQQQRMHSRLGPSTLADFAYLVGVGESTAQVSCVRDGSAQDHTPKAADAFQNELLLSQLDVLAETVGRTCI